MYICIAIITDKLLQNQSRKITYDLSQKSKISILSSRLPQHISLKQSFEVKHIEEIEEYFDSFVSNVGSLEIQLTKVDLCLMENETTDTQILWYEIMESSELRELHNKLNYELSDKFGIKMQGFDGSAFRFHSTITYDTNKEEIFKNYFDSLKSEGMPYSFNVKEIALLYCPDEKPTPGNFITYKIKEIS